MFAAAAFLVPHSLIATFVGTELPTLGGSLAGGTLFVVALILARRRQPLGFGLADDASLPPGRLLWAAAPYLVLVGAVLLTRLVPGIRTTLQGVEIAWAWEVFGGSMAVLYHPGTMLLLGFLVGAAWQSATRADVAFAMRGAAAQLLPVTLALFAMLGLSRVMVYAGMIDTLALAAATAAGGVWPLLAPFVGMLGTFVTGSATASNILFTDFQLATAERLGASSLALVGAQGFGAAVGNIICPHNIIAAGATVQLGGKEGEVLRRTLGVALLYALLGGLLALFVFA